MDKDIQFKLQNLGNEVLLEFLHACADDICGRKVQPYKNFKSCTNWNNEEYDETCAKIKVLLHKAIGSNLLEDQILQKIPELDRSHQQCILDCLEVRKNDIKTALIQKSCEISGSTLHDFDWKLKWVVGSSTLSSLREPLLQVDFYVSQGNDDEEPISLELNRNELSSLITALEKAQETIRNLQT